MNMPWRESPFVSVRAYHVLQHTTIVLRGAMVICNFAFDFF